MKQVGTFRGFVSISGKEILNGESKKEKSASRQGVLCPGVLAFLLFSGSIGVPADELGGEGRNITLEEAASAGDVSRIQGLLDKGADVNERDENGITPLHRAAGAGRLKAVEFLVSRHAEVNMKDNEGETPLFWGTGGGHKKIVNFLLAH